MQRINPKTGAKETIFKEYTLDTKTACPECNRPLDDRDIELLNHNDHIRCKKCGAILRK